MLLPVIVSLVRIPSNMSGTDWLNWNRSTAATMVSCAGFVVTSNDDSQNVSSRLPMACLQRIKTPLHEVNGGPGVVQLVKARSSNLWIADSSLTTGEAVFLVWAFTKPLTPNCVDY